jgi:hypothetical protein
MQFEVFRIGTGISRWMGMSIVTWKGFCGGIFNNGGTLRREHTSGNSRSTQWWRYLATVARWIMSNSNPLRNSAQYNAAASTNGGRML